MVVPVSTQPTFSAGVPRVLFNGEYDRSYDLAPDDQWVFMMKNERPAPAAELHVILGWLDQVTRRTRPKS